VVVPIEHTGGNMKNSGPLVVTGSVLLSLSSAVVAETAYTEKSDIRALLESEDWAVLKSIWQDIGDLKPSDGYSDFPVSMDKGDSLITVVNRLFADSTQHPAGVRTSLNLVRRVTALRLMRLSRINPALLTRMMPPWTDTVQDQLLFNFETRLASLDSLAESETFTPVEFAAARQVLVEKAELLAVLQVIEAAELLPYYRFGVKYSDRMSIDLLLQQIKLSYSAALDTVARYSPEEDAGFYREAAAQYEAFKKNFEEFEYAEPILRALLADLMEAGV